ncbi:MAG: dTDP-4-amino-4,6-dideoxygalactose transaminase [bacterium]
MKIPFNRPYVPETALSHIAEALSGPSLSGNSVFAERCQDWLQRETACGKALLTPSGTAALEMAALLADIKPGDEVIMPSFTFSSTANAFVLRGGIPVFVDIRPDTCNLDPDRIEAAITDRTRVIVPMHYAGVACEMEAILAIAEKHGLLVIEDAAQGVMSRYRGKSLGSLGHMAALSFHDTKNLGAGEGGALLINDPRFMARAEIIREKGTDRSRFVRGEVAKYSWVDVGSSFLPNALTEAFLWSQLEEAERITAMRLALWRRYHEAFADLEEAGRMRRPTVPRSCEINGHIYYLLLPCRDQRDAFIQTLSERGISAAFHYVPLHNSRAGRTFGRAAGDLENTIRVSDTLVRLPLWIGIEPHGPRVIQAVIDAVESWPAREAGGNGKDWS